MDHDAGGRGQDDRPGGWADGDVADPGADGRDDGGDEGPRWVDDERCEHEPWYAVWSPEGTWPGQPERQRDLVARADAVIGERVFVARGAAVLCDHLVIGDRSYIAAGCVLRDRLELGADCTLNPGVLTAGSVTLGDGVRVAAHAALFGENHVFDDPDTPIWHQGETSAGIVVEDDVWIGTHAVICDGVRVGAHSVVAAGAVVTRDVEPYSLVGGVPARRLRDRRDRRDRRRPARRGALERLDAAVRTQWRDVLERCRPQEGHTPFVDRPGAEPRARATCDAVELAAACGDPTAAGRPAELVPWLQDLQDPDTGLFPEPTVGLGPDPLACDVDNEWQQYGVLSVGYALEVLGAAPRQPVRVVEACSADELLGRLDALPWSTMAWPAGAWVDFWGTAVYLDRRHHGSARGPEAVLGWLQAHVDRRSGMWGPPDDTWGWLLPVNGWYRAVRGTYAQFGVPVPHPEAVVDTVLAHCRERRWFLGDDGDACNVLDVVHPLWLCARQQPYRGAEVRDQLAALAGRIADRWVDGAGFAFAPGGEPGLQGTEMWLSIAALVADHLGEGAGLSWSPKGVHRLEPAMTLPPAGAS